MHDIENCCSLLYICLWLFKYTKCSAVFFRSIQTLSLHFPDEPLFFFSVWALIKGWKEYFTRNSILALLYPIIVNPLYLIYSYLVGVCCLYEVWFIRLNAFHNGRLPWEYRFFLFRQCGFCMNKIQYFSTHWRFCYMDCSDYDFLKSYRLVEEGYRETTKKK